MAFKLACLVYSVLPWFVHRMPPHLKPMWVQAGLHVFPKRYVIAWFNAPFDSCHEIFERVLQLLWIIWQPSHYNLWWTSWDSQWRLAQWLERTNVTVLYFRIWDIEHADWIILENIICYYVISQKKKIPCKILNQLVSC